MINSKCTIPKYSELENKEASFFKHDN